MRFDLTNDTGKRDGTMSKEAMRGPKVDSTSSSSERVWSAVVGKPALTMAFAARFRASLTKVPEQS